jgi:hypothetical protein
MLRACDEAGLTMNTFGLPTGRVGKPAAAPKPKPVSAWELPPVEVAVHFHSNRAHTPSTSSDDDRGRTKWEAAVIKSLQLIADERDTDPSEWISLGVLGSCWLIKETPRPQPFLLASVQELDSCDVETKREGTTCFVRLTPRHTSRPSKTVQRDNSNPPI